MCCLSCQPHSSSRASKPHCSLGLSGAASRRTDPRRRAQAGPRPASTRSPIDTLGIPPQNSGHRRPQTNREGTGSKWGCLLDTAHWEAVREAFVSHSSYSRRWRKVVCHTPVTSGGGIRVAACSHVAPERARSWLHRGCGTLFSRGAETRHARNVTHALTVLGDSQRPKRVLPRACATRPRLILERSASDDTGAASCQQRGSRR